MWVSVYRVPPPSNKVISVRVISGDLAGSIMFAAYSRILDQWYLCANGKEEEIDKPQLWWCDDPAVSKEPENYSQIIPQQKMRRSNKVKQLELFSLPNIRPNS